MKTIVIGLGIQGKKRLAIAGGDVVATVDSVAPGARYRTVEQVPLDSFERALVCTPDDAKPEILAYLLSHGKHVLVEKPLMVTDEDARQLAELARANRAACYTAYNHRFEPHVINLKETLESGRLGRMYLARFFYGNGTAQDVKRSPWRDRGLGVLSDIGSHLLDMVLWLFGPSCAPFEAWSVDRFETQAPDHVVFGSMGDPRLVCEAALVSWRNTFTADVYGERGSAHINGLCKWGPSHFIVRTRVLPSGRPSETSQTLQCADPTWEREYRHFDALCRSGGTNLDHDVWIRSALDGIAQTIRERVVSS